MKNLLKASHDAESINVALLISRVGIAALMLTHGLPKMAMLFSGAPLQFPGILGMSPALSLGLAVFAEVFCSILLLVGFLTRVAVLPLIITMLVALIFIHPADPFSKQEPALQYLLVYLTLLLAGSGKYSLDYLLQSRQPDTSKANIEMGEHTASVFQ